MLCSPKFVYPIIRVACTRPECNWSSLEQPNSEAGREAARSAFDRHVASRHTEMAREFAEDHSGEIKESTEAG